MAQEMLSSASPKQLAASIARTMTATTPANSSITQLFFSHDNVVESRAIFRDANSFANAVAHRRDLQIRSTRYMCKAERLAFIKRGVVFRNVTVGPNAANSFAFVIDERACASLVSPVAADTATLTKMTQDIVHQLTTAPSRELTSVGSRLGQLTARDGVIQVTNIITTPAFVDFFRMKGFEIRGKTQGWFCGKFGDAIRHGVRVHLISKLEDGSPILEFPVDNSVC